MADTMALLANDADALARLAENIKEDMMLALMGELQGVASVCAKVCVQHMRNLQEGMLSALKEMEAPYNHDTCMVDTKSMQPCLMFEHNITVKDVLQQKDNNDCIAFDLDYEAKACSSNEETDGSAAIEAMYENLDNASAEMLTPSWQRVHGDMLPIGGCLGEDCCTGHHLDNPRSTIPRTECCIPQAEGIRASFTGTEAVTGLTETEEITEPNLACPGEWQPLPAHDHSDGQRAAMDRVRQCEQSQAITLRGHVNNGSAAGTATAPTVRSPAVSVSTSLSGVLNGATKVEAAMENASAMCNSDLLLWLPFDNTPGNSLVEVVSNMPGELVGVEPQAEFVSCHGRTGINFTGAGLLRLARPIELGANWTISFWILSPMATEWPGQEWRYLLDGPSSCRPVLLHHDLLGGSIGRPCFTRFRVSTLPLGWHHVAVVGKTTGTGYFVDGESVGEDLKPFRGTINGVGNKSHQHEVLRTCSWGVLSDLRIFGVAANAEQVRHLMRKDTQVVTL